VRLASSVAPRILTLSDSARMTAAATLTDLSQDRDFSLCGVPNKIATDLFELRAMPFNKTKYGASFGKTEVRRYFGYD